MTNPDWLPGVERVQGSDAGVMIPGAKRFLLLHTTEGDSLQGAIAALRAKSAWSHFIFDPDTGRLVQAVSMNRAAKALKSGGNFGKTNAAGAIQVEIVGHAHDTPNWSAERNAAVGKMIARIAASVPFRVAMPLPFYGDASGFTVASSSAKQRMSWLDWYRFDAICGHQHAPRNDHWDPGAINTAQILAAAHPQPTKDWFDMATEADLTRIVNAALDTKLKPIVAKIDAIDNELTSTRDASSPKGASLRHDVEVIRQQTASAKPKS